MSRRAGSASIMDGVQIEATAVTIGSVRRRQGSKDTKVNKTAGALFKIARILLTVSAIAGGRILPRIFNIAVGRGAARGLGRLWK